jgi:hypothetical protein
MLKQTMESSDRRQVLHTGDDKTYVNLGTIYDIAYNHKIPSEIVYQLEWKLPSIINILETNLPSLSTNKLFSVDHLKFTSEIQLEKDNIFIKQLCYRFNVNSQDFIFKFHHYVFDSELNTRNYTLHTQGYELKRRNEYQYKKNTIYAVPCFSLPIKNYAFSINESIINNYYENISFLYDFFSSYEEAFQKIYYLGPLREYPQRIYSWAGGEPQDVGHRGELAIPALASRKNWIEKKVAHWLKELGLIYSFRVTAIAENRQYYEVRVKRTPNASEVLITDVGFGVSQILPVLVLCYYAPEGSTIILEQPEIHLHPSVQSGLADVFIDVIKTRNLQIILESHSEHLLRRLQRRIAEEKDGLTNEDMSLYFCNLNSDGSSKLTALELDQFGNIANWPENFFGDEMGDLFAMTEAAMKRQMGAD